MLGEIKTKKALKDGNRSSPRFRVTTDPVQAEQAYQQQVASWNPYAAYASYSAAWYFLWVVWVGWELRLRL